MNEGTDIFKLTGLRRTRQREQIYAALCATTSHPTAEELYKTVRGSSRSLSLATVYNTLEVLTRYGLCQRLPCVNGAARYDADVTPHVHLVTSDGRVRDVPPDLGAKISSGLDEPAVAELERRMGLGLGKPCIQVVAERTTNPPSNGEPAGSG